MENVKINILQLNRNDIYQSLTKKKSCLDIQKLIETIFFTNRLTKSVLEPLLKNTIKQEKGLTNINPLHWEFGHIVNFWQNNTFKILDYKIDKHINNEYLFDSFRTGREERFEVVEKKMIESVDEISKIYDNDINNLIVKLFELKKKNSILDPTTSYIVNLSLLHNHMHIESFCFALQYLKQNTPILEGYFNNFKSQNDKIVENKYIKIKGGVFNQGWDDTEDNFTFDNEKPTFVVRVYDFSVSKYCVTQEQYKKFIDSDGYNHKEYWCPEGWRWKQKNNINLPLYWEYGSTIDKLMKLKWGVLVNIENNEPMCNISWYEANAYCRWANCRLPTEAEWEYLATNRGTSKYPWGDTNPNNSLANLNYYYDGVVDVDKYSKGCTQSGVQQLFGNLWEWCQEPIYPYNGFQIDPVYREMSYPFFGFKKICRGGSWCVPDFLINSKYRNGQSPDCRIQYIGFRTCI